LRRAETAPVVARASSPVRRSALNQQLLGLLGGYEDVPARAELLRVGPPDVLVAELQQIYLDPSVPDWKRLRALCSLRYFPGRASREAFENALSNPDTPVPILRAAVRAYGSTFREQAIGVLRPLLAHSDLHTRDAVALTLGEIGSPQALQLLKARADIEPEELVRATIRAQLR
jgi:HEAT repeat protein